MLTWMKAENGNRWIGFDDDCPCYFVDKDEDGWYWEDSWGFGRGDFDTAAEAMAECEKDLPKIDPKRQDLPLRNQMKSGLVWKLMNVWKSQSWGCTNSPKHQKEE